MHEAFDLEDCPIHSGNVDVLGGLLLGVLYTVSVL